MEPLVRITAVAAPLLRDNVDTDAIIPSREMRTVSKTGLADGLFAGWRYTEVGGRTPEPGFVLNQPAYAAARILLGGRNFGCGSSREHAVWALREYGFRAILAPSFSPIFQNNCVRNGVAPVELPLATIERMAAWVAADPPARPVTVDLERLIVSCGEMTEGFTLGAEPREMLMLGLDAIELTLRKGESIGAFQARDRLRRPWAYL